MVRELQTHRNFQYVAGQFVKEFREDGDQVTVQGFTARRLIIAAGALGTARIVLRSQGRYDTPLPLTCNAHAYVPCLLWRRLGRASKDRRHSLAQLTLIYDPEGDHRHLVQAQFFSYRSLLLYRLVKESPLPPRESLRILRAIAPAFGIWVMQHEDEQGPNKTCALRRDANGSDHLEINYRPTPAQEQLEHARAKAMFRQFSRLGCRPLKLVHPGHGSSIHYASTLPFSESDRPLTTEPSGKLRGTRNIFVADGSSFCYLPAKGLTLTLMANANRVGENVHRHLQESNS